MQFQQIAESLDQVQQTTKRLEKTLYLARFLHHVPKEQYEQVILLLQGKVFPEYDQTKLGVSTKLVLKALAQTTGQSLGTIDSLFNRLGDVGLVAEQVVGKKRQNTLYSEELSVNHVVKCIKKLPTFAGKNSVAEKLSTIAGLLGNCTAKEAKYICNLIVEQLRVGMAQGVLRDAIVWSIFPSLAATLYESLDFSWGKNEKTITVKDFSEIQTKDKKEYDKITSSEEDARKIMNDILDTFQASIDMSSSIALAAQQFSLKGIQGLSEISLQVFRPFHVMLAQKAPTISEGIESLGLPIIAEYKYDGFRMQIHISDGKIRLFTRRLEEVTEQFPDVVKRLQEHIQVKSAILDAEIVGIDKKTKKYIAFQQISQRIRRKYNIIELSEKFPVEVRVFDLLYHDGKSYLNIELTQRRKLLQKVVPEVSGLAPSEYVEATTEQQVNDFYAKSLASGNEGIMLKSKDSPYQPGSRVGFMLKCKPVMENLDVVIVRATKGEGKRAKWLTSFTVACKDRDGELLELGKVSTGLKELDEEGTSFAFMTQLLQPLIIHDAGKEVDVNPQVIIEVAYEEIQKSPSYSSGFALRFPRFVLLRDDRGLEDISDIDYIELLYKQQRGRNG